MKMQNINAEHAGKRGGYVFFSNVIKIGIVDVH